MPIPQFKKPDFRVKKIGARMSQFKNASAREKRNKLKRFFKWSFSNWLPISIISVIVILIAGVGAFAWFSRDLPDPDKIMERIVAESTKIYARDGETLLYEIHGDEQRTLIELGDIPLYMQQATIAIEDHDFYKHGGFDFGGIIKAMCHEAFGNLGGLCPQRGGSTITQQFVKNAVLTSERSYTRKIKELVLSYQIERKFTKDQILQLYFNEIPFGSTLYGVESAAQSFLGKSIKDITLSEAAFLAAIPQRPTYYSPYGNHIDELSARLHTVLNQMVGLGFITEEEAGEAKEDNIAARLNPKFEIIKAPHFVFYVREQLSERYGEKVIEQGGLKVTTTLNIDKQNIAEEAIEKYADRNEKNYNASNAALVSIDTKSGQILAMVGSKDYFNEEIDGNVNVVLRPRQPGSSFKPIAYLTAFNKGYTADTLLFDVVTTFKSDIKDYIPKNYDLVEHGPVPMRQALAGSLNIPAVKTLYLAGIDNVLNTAEAFGYTTLSDRSRFGLSLVLGGGEVTLLEHTSAFATLAREGIRHPVSSILKVEDNKGRILEEYEEREEKVYDTQAVRLLNSILSDDSARAYVFGAGSNLTIPGRPVAAKTGTTNDYRDAWTIGYTPSIATGVWVGNNDNSEMRRGAAGSVVAAPIWNHYMKNSVGGPAEPFKSPAANDSGKSVLQGKLEGEADILVDKFTGDLIPASCQDDYPEEFIEKKIFKVAHNILHYLDKDDPRGPAPGDPTIDPQYNNWEEPIKKWAVDNNFIEEKPPEGDCTLHDKKNKPIVEITKPDPDITVTKTSLTVTSTATTSRLIEKVIYYLDDIIVATLEKNMFSYKYDLTSNEAGFHDIKVEAIDDVGNKGSNEITINYLPG